MLLRVTTALTRNIQEVEKAYAMACFNVLAHNRDDHAKNFSFLLKTRRKLKTQLRSGPLSQTRPEFSASLRRNHSQNQSALKVPGSTPSQRAD